MKVRELLCLSLSHKYVLLRQTNTQIRNEFLGVDKKCGHFNIFGGLWVGGRGLDSKCQFQEEIIRNLFEVCVLVQISWLWPIHEWKTSSLSVSYNDTLLLKGYPSLSIFVVYSILRLPFSGLLAFHMPFFWRRENGCADENWIDTKTSKEKKINPSFIVTQVLLHILNPGTHLRIKSSNSHLSRNL